MCGIFRGGSRAVPSAHGVLRKRSKPATRDGGVSGQHHSRTEEDCARRVADRTLVVLADLWSATLHPRDP
jgi:hypothetical protein